MKKFELDIVPDEFCLLKFDIDEKIPSWIYSSPVFSITRAHGELSVICQLNSVPPQMRDQESWRAFRFRGPFDFDETGVLLSVLDPLAENEISIIALSTYDTDFVFIKADLLEKAVKVLQENGHKIFRPDQAQ